MNVVVLRRRLFYICAMVALLIPLYFLGNPSVRDQDGTVLQSGGTLAQLRTQYDLGQGDLGEIDPASESMRLATLGLRGVASTILWQKAEYYKKEQYWDRLAATLNQIAVLQPHFIKVWEFQSHNLSYNVSAEFDDYRQRYQWVKRGIDYLIKGSKYNKRRTEMPYELGWFFGNKMGVADEKVQFRELFRNDEPFHDGVLKRSGVDLSQPAGLGPDRKPDNWLAGRLWYNEAYDMVAEGSSPAKSPLMFYRMGPQWLMKHAEAIQSEGILDEAARYAWRAAGRAWDEFGQIQIKTSFGDDIRLKEIRTANEEFVRAKADFQEFCGDTYDELLAERRKKLSEEELEALNTPLIERTFDQVLAAEKAERALDINPDEVAKRMPSERRVEAIERAAKLKFAREHITHIEIYRNQINYPYWEARCVAEQDDSALLARTSMYEANQLLDVGELDGALEKYEIAWQAWSDLFNKYPAMMIDEAADNVRESITRYRRLLDEPELPDDFALSDFLEFRERYDESMADPAMMSVIAQWPEKYPGRNFLEEMLRKSDSMKEQVNRLKAEEDSTSPAADDDATVNTDADSPSPQPPQPPTASDEGDAQKNGTETEPAGSETGPEVDQSVAVAQPDAGRVPTPPAGEESDDEVQAKEQGEDSAESQTEAQPEDASQAESGSKERSAKEQSAGVSIAAPADGSAPKPTEGDSEATDSE